MSSLCTRCRVRLQSPPGISLLARRSPPPELSRLAPARERDRHRGRRPFAVPPPSRRGAGARCPVAGLCSPPVVRAAPGPARAPAPGDVGFAPGHGQVRDRPAAGAAVARRGADPRAAGPPDSPLHPASPTVGDASVTAERERKGGHPLRVLPRSGDRGYGRVSL